MRSYITNRSAAALLLCLGLTALLSACSDVTDEGTKPNDASLTGQTVDERLLELNRDTEGFGGLFYGEDGTLNVYMKRGEIRALSRETLRTTFADYLARPIRGTLSVQKKREINVLEGDYSFRELLEWRSEVDALGLEGVVLTDADERLNRVRVGVTGAAVKAALEARLGALGIPKKALVIEKVAPFKTAASLRGDVRPLVGGVEIGFSDFVCTLGFNASRRGERGFVTNSHCTDEQGGVEGTRYTQGSGRVGTERADPKYGDIKNCPPGRDCRLSDSAFVKVSGAKRTVGGVARTSSQNDFSNPDLRIAGQLEIAGEEATSFSGEELDKIGRSTGWTYGDVEETCVTVDVYDENGDTGLTLLCQNIIESGIKSGDSGAPVFRFAGGGKVYLRGILWGGDGAAFVFSPIDQVRKELRVSDTY